MEEIEPNEWGEKVYRPEIKNNLDRLYKKPEYDENDLLRRPPYSSGLRRLAIPRRNLCRG